MTTRTTASPDIKGSKYSRHWLSITACTALVLALLVSYRTFDMGSIVAEQKETTLDVKHGRIGNFRLVKRIALNYTDTVITKWQSQETGLRVVHIDYECPIVKGTFAVVTEISDDSGVPHTLEHLVLGGSAKYPYMDAFSRLSSRYMTQTPNAYTAQDHTAYTMSTAGGDSFLALLLPAYIDHILYPKLEKSAFVTEVFHINGEGKDAGVVYSEMQGRQNTAPDLMDLAYRRKLYPQGSGYQSETGGEMEALRELTLEQIKSYHSQNYVPHNLCLLVSGRVDTHKLLETVQNTIEASVISNGQNKGVKPEGWKRPFVETDSAEVPQLKEDTSIRVEFPAKEEKFGEINVVMVGPDPDDTETLGALSLIMEYMTGSIIAPLNKELVDVLFPYCTGISFGSIARAKFTELHLSMSDVPIKHLPHLEVKVRRTLKKILKKGIDMKRLHTLIDRNELGWKYGLEVSGGDTFTDDLLDDFKYGDDASDELEKGLQIPVFYQKWRSWSEKQWIDVLTKWFIEPKMLVVRAYPSSSMSERLEREEKQRVEAQVARLGEKGLEEKKQILEDAKKRNDVSMPDEDLISIPIPDHKSIPWITIQSASTFADSADLGPVEAHSKELAAYLAQDQCKLPYVLNFDHASSNFVTLTLYISLAEIPDDKRHLLYIFDILFFASTVTLEDGTQLKEEDLVKRLDQDLLSYTLNQCDEYPELACLSITAEVSKYEIAIQWMRRLLWSSKYDISKLENRVAIIKQAIPEYLRDPESTMSDIEGELLFTERSTSRPGRGRQLLKWIPEFERQVKRDAAGVIKELNSVRSILLKPSNLHFSIIGNIMAIPDPRSSWLRHFEPLKAEPSTPIRLTIDTLSELGRNPTKKAFVISLPNVESSFSDHYTRGIIGFNSEDIPALMVALGVLNGAELFFWKRIRGAGLAYGASASMDVQQGSVEFSAYRSANPVRAFQEAKTVVEGLVDGSIPLDQLKLEAAKTSYAYMMAESYSTAIGSAYWEFINRVMRKRSSTWKQDRVAAVLAVTIEDALVAMRKYVLPLFDPERSVAFIVCGPTQVQDVATGYEEAGYQVEVRHLNDSVPWADENKVLMKAMKWLGKTIYSTQAVVERAHGLFRTA